VWLCSEMRRCPSRRVCVRVVVGVLALLGLWRQVQYYRLASAYRAAKALREAQQRQQEVLSAEILLQARANRSRTAARAKAEIKEGGWPMQGQSRDFSGCAKAAPSDAAAVWKAKIGYSDTDILILAWTRFWESPFLPYESGHMGQHGGPPGFGGLPTLHPKCNLMAAVAPGEPDVRCWSPCRTHRIFWTTNRSLLSAADIVWFFLMHVGSELQKHSIPCRAFPSQKFMVGHLERPSVVSSDVHSLLGKFDYFSGYQRYADLHWPYFSKGYTDPWVGLNSTVSNLLLKPPLRSWTQKQTLANQYGKRRRAPVAWVSSNCLAQPRTNFVLELMKYIAVDSYGGCHHNQNPRGVGGRAADIYGPVVSQHKFVLVMENDMCEDYASEKFLHGLASGAVPIVFSRRSAVPGVTGELEWKPNYGAFAPSPDAYIDVADFNEDPHALAQYLLVRGLWHLPICAGMPMELDLFMIGILDLEVCCH
jgi:hypothetical protein